MSAVAFAVLSPSFIPFNCLPAVNMQFTGLSLQNLVFEERLQAAIIKMPGKRENREIRRNDRGTDTKVILVAPGTFYGVLRLASFQGGLKSNGMEQNS